MPARPPRLLACLAALVAGCSDPQRGERSAPAGEALTLAPDLDVWTIVEAGDFNGDGLQDALWNDADRSEVAVWLLRGTELVEAGPPIPGPGPGPEWAAVTAADFNQDGM